MKVNIILLLLLFTEVLTRGRPKFQRRVLRKPFKGITLTSNYRHSSIYPNPHGGRGHGSKGHGVIGHGTTYVGSIKHKKKFNSVGGSGYTSREKGFGDTLRDVGYGHASHHSSASGYTSGTYGQKDPCRSKILTCVEKKECGKALGTAGHTDGHLCPPFYTFNSKFHYCASVNLEQMQNLEGVELCKSQGGRLLHIESIAEFKLLVSEKELASSNFFLMNDKYWLDAYYSQKRSGWISRADDKAINWNLIFPHVEVQDNSQRNIDVVKQINPDKRCLAVQHDTTHPEKLKVSLESCTSDLEVLCKLGQFTNDCKGNTRHTCCFIPSYDHYVKYHVGGPGSIYKDCSVEVLEGTELQTQSCEKVLLKLNAVTAANMPLKVPYRIGSSYFYVSDTDCIGKDQRRAVVSSRKIHEFISRLMVMANLQAANTYTSFRIGLTYKGNQHKIVWDSGFPHDFYDETFWNGNRPDFDGLGDSTVFVCGKYVVSSNEFEYRWELSQTCTISGSNLQVCELPIRTSTTTTRKVKESCGQRSAPNFFSKIGPYSNTATLFGSFPWHAAVYKASYHIRGLSNKFACSGVLIHPKIVLTAAHCVGGPEKSLTVALGEYIVGGAKSLLERVVVGVHDIILYPGYAPLKGNIHDIALLQLDKEVATDNHPHVNVACLPYPDVFYGNPAQGNCYIVGWKGKSGALQNTEAKIVSKRLCQIHNRVYRDAAKHSFGHHLFSRHDRHHIPDLMCATPSYHTTCVDDPGAVLMCRQPRSAYGYAHGSYASHTPLRSHSRFHSAQWTVVGISHGTSNHHLSCFGSYFRRHRQTVHVFTPVNEYLSFLWQ